MDRVIHSCVALVARTRMSLHHLDLSSLPIVSLLASWAMCSSRADSGGHVIADFGVQVENTDLVLPGTARLGIKLGVNMPARAIRRTPKIAQDSHPEGELFGDDYDVVLYFGIIDILQDYDISKRLEHAYKSVQFDSHSISAVDPKLYSKRFQDFICRTFPGKS